METDLGLGNAVGDGRDGGLSQLRRSSARTLPVQRSEPLSIQAAAIPTDNPDRTMKDMEEGMV